MVQLKSDSEEEMTHVTNIKISKAKADADSGIGLEVVKKSKKKKKEIENPEEPIVVKKKKKKKRAAEEEESGLEIKTKKQKIAEPESSESDETEAPEPEIPFKDIWDLISEQTRNKLTTRGVVQLFPVQAKTYEACYAGKDLIVQSRTGSGKTFAFGIPIVEKLQADDHTTKRRGRLPRALILAPTRELASQICRDVESISTTISTVAVYGGVPYEKQEKMLNKGVDVVVGTPGRMKDLINKGTLKFADLKIIALDEVDRMLDMGFAQDVDELIGSVYENQRPQTLFFSATCPAWVKETAKKYMEVVPDVLCFIDKFDNKTPKTIHHLAIKCAYQDRPDIIGDLLTAFCGKFGRAVVFAETKKEASELALSERLSDAQMIHGDIEQKTREQTLQAFRDGKVKTLVATDVAARGLDIPEIDLVVQTAPPSDIDSYIHRSGRTGRAGRNGTCICLYKPNQYYNLQKVEHAAGFKFEHRGPISSAELEEAAAKDVKEMIAKLPTKSAERFTEVAREMIAGAEEEGSSAEDLLAAAIAIMSGVTEDSTRSMITATKGFQTWQLDVNFELRSTYFIYNMLEKSIGIEARTEAKSARLMKSNQGGVFDLPTKMTPDVHAKFTNSEKIQLKQCEVLPELIPLKFEERGGRNNGGRRGGSGGFNRNSGRGGGGFRGSSRGGNRGGNVWKRHKY